MFSFHCRLSLPSDVVPQLGDPLFFVDFLREPTCDPETGEVTDAHPSFYEAVAGGLSDIRHALLVEASRFSLSSMAPLFIKLCATWLQGIRP